MLNNKALKINKLPIIETEKQPLYVGSVKYKDRGTDA